MFNYENSKKKRSVLFTLDLNERYVWNKKRRVKSAIAKTTFDNSLYLYLWFGN